MADLDVVITGVVAGDDYDLIRDISLIPVGQKLVSAVMTIKENHWDADSIIVKNITGDISGGGIIEDDGEDDETARVRFTLLSSDTILLKPFYTYVYDIQVTTDAGKIHTPESGTLTPFSNISAE